jgi:hypothetical protein
MQPDTLNPTTDDLREQVYQRLLSLSDEKLEAVLNVITDLSLSLLVPTMEDTPQAALEQAADITKTKTWSAIGKYQIPNPAPQYLVSSEDGQELTTNYAENVDDILYPPTGFV